MQKNKTTSNAFTENLSNLRITASILSSARFPRGCGHLTVANDGPCSDGLRRMETTRLWTYPAFSFANFFCAFPTPVWDEFFFISEPYPKRPSGVLAEDS